MAVAAGANGAIGSPSSAARLAAAVSSTSERRADGRLLGGRLEDGLFIQ